MEMLVFHISLSYLYLLWKTSSYHSFSTVIETWSSRKMITRAKKLIKENAQYLKSEQSPVLTVDQPLYVLSSHLSHIKT